jgi:hypothetical protein
MGPLAPWELPIKGNQNPEALPADTLGRLGNRWVFDLSDAIANEASLGARRAVVEAACRRLERLAAQDPSNAAWQRDLVVSHYKLATLADQQADAATAREEWQRCHAVLRRMQAARMFLDPPLVELLEELDRQGHA